MSEYDPKGPYHWVEKESPEEHVNRSWDLFSKTANQPAAVEALIAIAMALIGIRDRLEGDEDGR